MIKEAIYTFIISKHFIDILYTLKIFHRICLKVFPIEVACQRQHGDYFTLMCNILSDTVIP